MRQKFCVALAVVVLTLSGARETYKQFNGLRSLVGEWSGAWNTMLVYAGAYADGAEGQSAPTLIASSTNSCRAAAAPAPAATRDRGARAKIVRESPRAHRDETAEWHFDLEESDFEAEAESTAPDAPAAPNKVAGPRLRVAANAGELASALTGAFHSDFDAESLRKLTATHEFELRRVARPDEVTERRRAVMGRKATRVEGIGAGGGRVKKHFVFRMAEPPPPRASAEAPHGAEAAVEMSPTAEAGGGPVGLGEGGVFFIAPQSGSGVLNCEALPRR
jgi:hypothetical protein